MQFVNPTCADWLGGDGAFQSQSDYHDRLHESHKYKRMHEAGRDSAEWIRNHTAQSSKLEKWSNISGLRDRIFSYIFLKR